MQRDAGRFPPPLRAFRTQKKYQFGGTKRMKYKSLRFFIDINEVLGWSVIIGGGLLALFALKFFGEVAGPGPAFVMLIVIGVFSAVQGILIFAVGNVFQCFIDIEENTKIAAGRLKNVNGSNLNVETRTESTPDYSSSSGFTYMCPSCSTFLMSNVLSCPTCGTANPHHSSNKAKTEASKADPASDTASSVNQCLRCGAGINQSDKFCSSCGYART